MLKALFFDMDETLCDTNKANTTAKALLAREVEKRYGKQVDGAAFADAYVRGIYRQWTEEQRKRYTPIIRERTEAQFRVQLIRDLLGEYGIAEVTMDEALSLQEKFDRDRLDAFDFYPGIKELRWNALGCFKS